MNSKNFKVVILNSKHCLFSFFLINNRGLIFFYKVIHFVFNTLTKKCQTSDGSVFNLQAFVIQIFAWFNILKEILRFFMKRF